MNLTLPEIVDTKLNRILIVNSNCLSAMRASCRNVFDLCWTENPQEVCDQLGTDAVKAFEAHGKLQELIYLMDPTWQPLLPPYEYVKNEDGTITIGELIS